MDPLWIAAAFILGFAVKQIGLPPLVGFLATGFVLNQFGVEGGEALDQIADFGVLLLLFSIGLKLDIRQQTARLRQQGCCHRIGPATDKRQTWPHQAQFVCQCPIR